MNPISPFYFEFPDEDIAEFQKSAAEVPHSGVLILGKYTERFERSFAEFAGTRHAISVNSGSSALEFLLRLKGVKDKTVLVPTNTNFATVAAVLRAGGHVRYLDMSPETFAPTLSMVHETHRNNVGVAGILWVHIGGVISPEFPDVVRFAHDNGMWVLEDAAHAHGSRIHGSSAGNLADGGAFSFFPTKVMTTCEGGIIVTNSEEEDYLARSLRNQGKRGANYGGYHEDFGNSSRMTEINAIIGTLQLRRLPEMLRKRQRAYDVIVGHLKAAGVEYVSTAHMDQASQYKLIVRLPGNLDREQLKKKLAAEGVILGGGVYELPCHQQPVFQQISAPPLPGADQWCPRHICPPLTSAMTDADSDRVGRLLAQSLAGVAAAA